MKDARFVFLGTGTGEPAADRSASGLALITGDGSVLIDAGDGVARNWARYIGDTDSLSAVILSHLHADHVSGLPYLLQGLHLSQRGEPLRLYSPPGTAEKMVRCLETVELASENLKFQLNWGSLGDGDVRIEDVVVRPFPNTHLEADNSGDPRSYSLLISDGERCAAYSSDLGGMSDLDPLVGPGPDLLIVEATHFPPEDIFDYIIHRPPKRLVFTHIPIEFDADRIVSLGLKAGLARVEVATDGMEVSWA
jgi:ribonuclease BN (tRNA processing enzyme)